MQNVLLRGRSPSGRAADVVCFGEALWDMFEAGPRGKEPIARVFRREVGGAQANVATALARLGVRVALVGGVGTDRLGRALTSLLARDGVDVRHVQRLRNRTGMTFVVRGPRGEPEFLPYRERSADLALRPELLRSSAGRSSWAVVGTSTFLTEASTRATERFLALAAHGGARLLVDLNVRAHLWPDARTMHSAIAQLAGRAAIVKASDADLRALGAQRGSLRWLERNAAHATWIVTRGPREATAIGEHGETSVPAMRRRCVDATGAGDAFVAGALATVVAARAVPDSGAWRTPELWEWALRVGHVMASRSISRQGAVAGLVGLGEAKRLVERVRRRFA
jgi:fructokinase